jgi:hypothetical protein
MSNLNECLKYRNKYIKLRNKIGGDVTLADMELNIDMDLEKKLKLINITVKPDEINNRMTTAYFLQTELDNMFKSCNLFAKYGCIQLLSYARNKTPQIVWDESTCIEAIKNGHLETLQWLINNGCPHTNSICNEALNVNNIDMLKWLMTIFPAYFTNYENLTLISTSAVQNKNIDMLKWSMTTFPAYFTNYENFISISKYTVQNKNIDMLEWLRKQLPSIPKSEKWFDSIRKESINNNNIDILKWTMNVHPDSSEKLITSLYRQIGFSGIDEKLSPGEKQELYKSKQEIVIWLRNTYPLYAVDVVQMLFGFLQRDIYNNEFIEWILSHSIKLENIDSSQKIIIKNTLNKLLPMLSIIMQYTENAKWTKSKPNFRQNLQMLFEKIKNFISKHLLCSVSNNTNFYYNKQDASIGLGNFQTINAYTKSAYTIIQKSLETKSVFDGFISDALKTDSFYIPNGSVSETLSRLITIKNLEIL